MEKYSFPGAQKEKKNPPKNTLPAPENKKTHNFRQALNNFAPQHRFRGVQLSEIKKCRGGKNRGKKGGGGGRKPECESFVLTGASGLCPSTVCGRQAVHTTFFSPRFLPTSELNAVNSHKVCNVIRFSFYFCHEFTTK